MSNASNSPKNRKAKIFYLIAGAFIFSFALIYLRNVFPPLRDLCAPINADLDNIQAAVQRSLSGDPLAILTVLSAPLGIVVILVKAFTGRLNTEITKATVAKTGYESQISRMDSAYNTQMSELEKSKLDAESSLTSARGELDRANTAYRAQTNELSTLKDENARLREELARINAVVG